MSSKQRVAIYGSKDYAILVGRMARECGHEIIGFIDDFETSSKTLGSFLDFSKANSPSSTTIAIGIGYKNLSARAEAMLRVKEKGYELAKLIHPKSHVSDRSEIGEGSILMATAYLDETGRLGKGCVVWPGAVINHDCVIGDNVFISPGAIICGFAKIGAGSFIGAGAVIVDGVTLEANSFVKAGSLVKSDQK